MSPKNIQSLHALPDGDRDLKLWCGGVSMDPKKTAKYEYSGEWQCTLSLERCRNDMLWAEFGNFVQKAEQAENLLKQSLGKFWENLSKETTQGETAYQVKGGVEHAQKQSIANFWKKLDDLVAEKMPEMSLETLSEFNKFLRDITEKCFFSALPCSTPRQIMALAEIQPYFRKGLHNIFEKNQTGGNKQ